MRCKRSIRGGNEWRSMQRCFKSVDLCNLKRYALLDLMLLSIVQSGTVRFGMNSLEGCLPDWKIHSKIITVWHILTDFRLRGWSKWAQQIYGHLLWLVVLITDGGPSGREFRQVYFLLLIRRPLLRTVNGLACLLFGECVSPGASPNLLTANEPILHHSIVVGGLFLVGAEQAALSIINLLRVSAIVHRNKL